MSVHNLITYLAMLLATTSGAWSSTLFTRDTRQYKSCSEAPTYCEQEKYGGGWLVFQNRYDGSIGFNRSWDEYKQGFGNMEQEFWLGLEKIHQIFADMEHELLIVIENFTDFSAHEIYPGFRVEDEASNYTLRLSNEEYSYHGTARDSFWVYRNEQFSTFDRIKDKSILDCSILTGSGYWHFDCGTGFRSSNLNGEYGRSVLGGRRGIWWGTFGGQQHPLRKTRMMVKVGESGEK